METKTCTTCHRTLPVTEFHKNKAMKDGYSIYCKECYNKRRNEQRAQARSQKAVEKKQVEETRADQSWTVDSLREKLERLGARVLINYTPRDLMRELVALGYQGTLEYYEKKTINLKTINQ